MLSTQDFFDPSVADLDLANSNIYWVLFQSICKNDILWAALSVCGYLRSSRQNSHSSQTPGLPIHQIPTHSKASLIRTVEATLDALIRKVAHTGSNVKDVLLLAIVLQSVRARGSAEAKDQWMQEGAKKAFAACRQQLLPSVADESVADSIAEFAQMLQPNQTLFLSNDATGFTPSVQLPHLLGNSSDLLDEFTNFQGDLFQFDDASFTWNT